MRRAAVEWWRHQMETLSAWLALCAGNSPVPLHKGQWRGALMFSMICVWINGWVNTREAGDLRRNQDHYDVIVMGLKIKKYIDANMEDILMKLTMVRQDNYIIVWCLIFSNSSICCTNRLHLSMSRMVLYRARCLLTRNINAASWILIG